MDNISKNILLCVCVPELFFFSSIFIIFIFYLLQFFHMTFFQPVRDRSFLFVQVLKFSIYNLFFISVLFVYQFCLLQVVGKPIFLFNSMVCFDLFSTFFKFLIVLISGFILSSAQEYFIKFRVFYSEYIIIFLIFVFSLVVGLSANDFLLFYISLELQSLCVYILLINGGDISNFKTMRAGVKYFFYSIISSAFLLLGFSFVYVMFGTSNFSNLWLLFSTSSLEFKNSKICITTQLLILCSVFFKLGIAPFHGWVVTTYAHNTLPTVFAVSTVSKLFAFFILIQFLFIFDAENTFLLTILYWLGIFSVLVGVFGALFQTEILKIIGYSAIAHLGYSLVILSFFDSSAITISVFYFLTYIFLSFSFFYVFIGMFKTSARKKFVKNNFTLLRFVHEFKDVFKSNWLLALFFSVTFFSYSGLPPFFGFYSKYFMFYYLVQHQYFFTFFFLFFLSVISTYYYLVIIVSIYFNVSDSNSVKPNNDATKISFSNSLMLILFLVLNSFAVFGINYFFSFIVSFFLCLINCFLLSLAIRHLEFTLKKNIKFTALLQVENFGVSLVQIFLFVLIQRNFGIICRILLAVRLFCSILLNLLIMQGISKYYIYSARLSVYEELELTKFIRRVAISDLVNIEYFTDGFFHITFYGFCVGKTNKGIGSSFELSDKFSLCQRFFIFSPWLKKITIFTRRVKKRYL